MLGTIVNAASVLTGSLIGLLLRKSVPDKLMSAIMAGNALCVMYIGIDGALKGENTLAVIIAMAVGAAIGTALDLDGRMNRLGQRAESLFKNGGDGRIAQGFVTASLLFCVGAMAIVGSLQSGLTGDHSMIYTKSILDGISSIVLSASLGMGVALSAAAILVYQGIIVLLAGVAAPLLTDAVIAEMTCVGSILIVGMGLNMLNVTKLKVMDYVPAIFIVIAICFIM